jgi:hypothetical protein
VSAAASIRALIARDAFLRRLTPPRSPFPVPHRPFPALTLPSPLHPLPSINADGRAPLLLCRFGLSALLAHTLANLDNTCLSRARYSGPFLHFSPRVLCLDLAWKALPHRNIMAASRRSLHTRGFKAVCGTLGRS